jgi:iron complex outermembrane recepter protein
MRDSLRLLGRALLLLAGASAAIAIADSATTIQGNTTAPADASGTAAGGSDQLEQVQEVVVTARRREEQLKDVPIAITAISGEQLAEDQINTVKDIAAYTPGLNINSDSVGRVFMSIRGVGTTLIDSVQPGVGIFFDGIYAPDTSYLNSPTNDVERIEVLRGPQGTLFGNSTLGGAINVVTRQPSDHFEGHADLAYAGTDNYETAALSLSGPIIPGTLQGRIAVSYHDQDGFQKNILAGGYANPLDERSAHGTLRWEPADFATITFNGYWDRVAGGNTPYNYVTGTDDFHLDADTNLNSIATYSYKGGNVKGVFDLKSISSTVTAVGAYDYRYGFAYGDGDYGPVDFLRFFGQNSLKTTSGEVRFDTTYNDQLSSLIGIFANHYINDLTGTTTLVPLSLTVPSSGTTDQLSQAIYGTLFWKLRPDLELAAGLRYDHQTVDATNTGARAPEYKANELEPRVTLTKHLTPDFMTYASVARGFRGGGSNGPGAPDLIYKGDSVWTYELGTKTSLLDHKVVLDADVFYNDYSNFIGANTLAPSTTGVGFVAVNLNTGDVKSYGAELEAHYSPVQQLRFDAGLTLLHARITNDAGYQAITGVPVPTDRILFTPDWNYNLGVNYYVPMPNGHDRVMFDLAAVGKGNRVADDLANPNVPVMPSYSLVNAAITYRWPTVDFAVFSTNLLDAKYQESYIDHTLLTAGGFPPPLIQNLAIQGERRRIGVRVRWNF